MAVGAPASGIGVRDWRDALTPPVEDRVPGTRARDRPPRRRHPILTVAAGRGGRDSLGASCPAVSLVPGGCVPPIGGPSPTVPRSRDCSHARPPAPAAASPVPPPGDRDGPPPTAEGGCLTRPRSARRRHRRACRRALG